MAVSDTPPATAPGREPAWLLLVHQLPAKPSNARVKTWRRLQNVGALAVKNSVYVLPNSAQSREDLEWIKTEIAALKGQATVFAADHVDSLSGDEIVAAFRRARQQDFEAIRREAGGLLDRTGPGRMLRSPLRRRLGRAARLLRERWTHVQTMDFFGAPGRDEAAAALDNLERLLKGGAGGADGADGAAGRAETGSLLSPDKFRDRLWVTRPHPGIDRMASAWLIRRFIDPRATFSFADKLSEAIPAQAGKGAPAEAGRRAPATAGKQTRAAVPFDMFGVEFGHQGNHCTFETLARRFGIAGPAVEWLGQMVHNLDLKDGRHAAPEAPAIGRLVDGMRQMYPHDHELLERGMAVFEALYRSFTADAAESKRTPRQMRGATSASGKPRR